MSDLDIEKKPSVNPASPENASGADKGQDREIPLQVLGITHLG